MNRERLENLAAIGLTLAMAATGALIFWTWWT